MKRSKTPISKATTYKEIAEFWDTHSLADYWDRTKPADFQVNLQSEVVYYPLVRGLALQIRKMARQQGVRPETLLNIWVQEKLEKA
jgi:hypothetical protein